MMSTAESVKAQLTALIAQANEATGKTYADLTAAFASLIEGFGQGGEFATGEIIGDGVIHDGENPIQIPLSFEPDILLIRLMDDTAASVKHMYGGFVCRDVFAMATYRAANNPNPTNSGFSYNVEGMYGAMNNKAHYENGVVFWVLHPASGAMLDGASYTWVARKW